MSDQQVRVPTAKHRYIQVFTAHGRTYYYFRRRGQRAKLPGSPGSLEFEQAYSEMLFDGPCLIPRSRSSVYFVKVGRRIKIGVTIDLKKRLSQLKGVSAEPIQILAAMPGDSGLEKRLHKLFAESRIRNEFFRNDPLVRAFIALVREASTIQYVEALERWYQKSPTERRAIKQRIPARELTDEGADDDP